MQTPGSHCTSRSPLVALWLHALLVAFETPWFQGSLNCCSFAVRTPFSTSVPSALCSLWVCTLNPTYPIFSTLPLGTPFFLQGCYLHPFLFLLASCTPLPARLPSPLLFCPLSQPAPHFLLSHAHALHACFSHPITLQAYPGHRALCTSATRTPLCCRLPPRHTSPRPDPRPPVPPTPALWGRRSRFRPRPLAGQRAGSPAPRCHGARPSPSPPSPLP